jgi:hypothetical protein
MNFTICFNFFFSKGINIAMNYRTYLMQMAQRGKVRKTSGTLQVMNKQPYIKRSFSGSTAVYSG